MSSWFERCVSLSLELWWFGYRRFKGRKVQVVWFLGGKSCLEV